MRNRRASYHRSGGAWQVYGGLNAFAQLIEDAGGDYLFKKLLYRHSLYEMPFEYVYDRGAEADVWIVGPDLSSQFADGKPRFDERLKKLKAAQNFFVSYNPTKDDRTTVGRTDGVSGHHYKSDEQSVLLRRRLQHRVEQCVSGNAVLDLRLIHVSVLG